ncbi:MAG: Ppx/GppA family phosphatase [Bdellovibrionales bacterium]|nr:Ppx/GppA family phosphatase [Bdellovibrionales bacterium]
MRIASLDLGSNTTLMLVADINEDGLSVVEDCSTVTRMGQEIAQTGRLHTDALKRLDSCLADYSKKIEAYNVESVVAVATSAARDAENSDELLEITARHGIPVSVISGQKEAEITFLGSTFDQAAPKDQLVIDIGGGSTELVSVNSDGEVVGQSLDIGSVRILDMFIKEHPVPQSQFVEAREFIDSKLSEHAALLDLANGKSAVAVAGTPTTLAMIMQQIDFAETKIHGFKIDLSQVGQWVERLAGMSVDERRKLPGMPEKRADVMVAGCLILHRVLEKLGLTDLSVSTKGVRYGIAIEEFRKKSQD